MARSCVWKNSGYADREADAAPAHERVGLALVAEVGDELVAAEVERADGDARFGRRLDDGAIGGELLLLVGHGRMREEQILGAIEPDADRPGVARPSRRRRGR